MTPIRLASRRLACTFGAAATLALGAGCATAGPGAAWTSDEFFHAVNIDDGSGVKRALAAGFDPNTVDARGTPALSVALQGESLRAAQALWEAPGIQLDAQDKAGETPLMMAALKADAGAADALVARGAAVQKDGWTPLHYAATGGNVTIIKLLLAHGAPLEARSPNRSTPLMMAARYGSEDAVDALLAAGADRSLKNDQGMDAAAFATSAGRDKLAARIKAPGSSK